MVGAGGIHTLNGALAETRVVDSHTFFQFAAMVQSMVAVGDRLPDCRSGRSLYPYVGSGRRMFLAALLRQACSGSGVEIFDVYFA